ncbi:sodium:solute symporter family protein [Mangrovivirga sp. M17]|uniref:Sodium:solute symporter family protein n=1 Tax=Mangrovivirga halotolerans TaxID=2993936 RepID=A0ABT3RUH1_9BACT|nr:sodium:solute symporter family protein [Mangrovivirga halotolerans]MCX2744790.1 sodium:solute symporter family protein [Mangrovivirga halotolerans]
MNIIDLAIFAIYMIAMLGVGFFFLRKNEGLDDYYVGGRGMSSWHIGLSVVATDVGGGFSIGLGGLGFTMGISGSWMLFTGLLGAWLAAVFLIPVVRGNTAFSKFHTMPQVYEYFFDKKVAITAAIISAIGYAGFTSSQILAGAKLASGTFQELNLSTALIIMGSIAVVYTVMGGIKAVIYTDTIQWIILLSGLIFIGIPLSYYAIGGLEGIQATVKPEMLSLANISWQDIVYWVVTIIPIWFVGMTLYQRIYACKDVKTAKKAWYIAGLFEWPVMAFMGVALGLFARVAADQGMFDYLGAENIAQTDPEQGLPMLLRTILPVGLLGLMMSAYFSAILSTADSCLMASSGNIVSDFIQKFTNKFDSEKSVLRLSQVVTLMVGVLAILIASVMENVLSLMLYSYAFMVSGLFVPIMGALFWKKSSPTGAFWGMITGGLVTALLQANKITLPTTLTGPEVAARLNELSSRVDLSGISTQSLSPGKIISSINSSQIIHVDYLDVYFKLPYNLDPNVFGITASAFVFIVLSLIYPKLK